ncbi:hypothetical protein [Pseudanabaena sp. 'Roaring Creek']|uniref:hypothetical protein n=1 Tax=Pseudanabaena sp. 'Roaring Creek' TaxID=1681830 RepID=UPI0006D77A33|nr:hypothetical protein [Pseudanabaena sp. 'Roaring Creek']
MITYTTKRQSVDRSALVQPDASTCQSAAICEALGKPAADIETVRTALLGLGTAGDPTVMGAYLKSVIGDKYRYNGNASLLDMLAAIRDLGAFLIIHTSLTISGHVISINAVDTDDTGIIQNFHVFDSWSEFDGASFSYPSLAEDCFAGLYSKNLIYSACVADDGKFETAKAQYLLDAPDSQKKGAWVHIILP